MDQVSHIDVVLHEEEMDNSDDQPVFLEWSDSESNKSADFEVVTPKRNRKPPRRLSLSLIPKQKKKKGTNKTKPCNSSQISSGNQRISGSSNSSFNNNYTLDST